MPPTSRGDLLDEALTRAGVPWRFSDSRLATYHASTVSAKAALTTAQAYHDDEQRNLILSGPPGTGKTHLAAGILAAMAWERAERDAHFATFRARFAVVPRLMENLRAGVRDPQVEDPLPQLLEAPLLVLDDLGVEKLTDWVGERLYLLVNDRYNDRSPTIVTSNYSLDQLADRGYERIISRLCQDGDLVRIDAPDYRLGRRR